MSNSVCSTCNTHCNHNPCSQSRPLVIAGCSSNRCLELTACRQSRFAQISYGCDPASGNDLEFGSVTNIEVFGWYINDNGYKMMAIRKNLIEHPVNFETTANKSFTFIMSAIDTKDTPAGILDGEIWVTTVEYGRFLLASDLCFEVIRSHLGELAPPTVCVNVDSCNFLEINLNFIGTVNPNVDGEVCSFSVNWNDGSAHDVVPVEGVPITDWVASHTYEADFTGEIEVTATNCYFDPSDVCECPSSGTQTIMVSLCEARPPLSILNVTSTGVIDTSNSRSIEDTCDPLVTTTTQLRAGDCDEPVIETVTGVPEDAVAGGTYAVGGTNELIEIDWIQAFIDTGAKTYCVENFVEDGCNTSDTSQYIYTVPSVNIPVINSNNGLAMSCALEFPLIGGWNNTAYDDLATFTADVQTYLDTLLGAGNTVAEYNELTCQFEVCYNASVTPPELIPARPLDSVDLPINLSNGTGAIICPPIEWPLVLTSNATAYFNSADFLTAYQTQLDGVYGAGLTIAEWNGCEITVQYYPTVTFVEAEVAVDPLVVTNLLLVEDDGAGANLGTLACPLTFQLQAMWTGAPTLIFNDLATIVQAFNTFVEGNNAQPEYATATLALDGCSIDVTHTAGATIPADVRLIQL